MADKLRLFALIALVLSVISFTACGAGPSPMPPPTVTLVASQTTINAGQNLTLTWTSTNATSLSIDNSVGTVTGANGSVTVTPAATTTYTITASNGSKMATAAVTVTVNAVPAKPSVTLTIAPTIVAGSQPFTLTWTSANAKSVAFSPALPGDDVTGVATSGNATLVGTHTTTYTITGTGTDGSTASQSATVTVVNATLSASAATIVQGQSVNLTWNTESATSASIDNGVGPVTGTTGTVSVSPQQTTTYTLTAVNGSVTSTSQVTVTVTSPLTVTLTANPASIQAGQSAALQWTSANATKLSIDNNVGDVTSTGANGSVNVTPAKTTTYTITATGASGNTTTATATVNVLGVGMQNIKHIIFLVQENRSFDNYFSQMNVYRAGKGLSTDVNVADNTVQLPTFSGGKASPFHQRTVCTENLTPSWDESHYDTDVQPDGTFKMDRFMLTTHSVTHTYDNDGLRAIGYYDQNDLPYYYELASQYAMSDSFHSAILANTQPNRLYLFGATSQGRTYPDNGGHPAWPIPTIFGALQNAGVSWGYYYQDNIFLAQFQDWSNPVIQNNTTPIQKYYDILASPTADQDLPSVVFIENTSSTGYDEHPGSGPLPNGTNSGIQYGAANVKKIIDALQNSGAWGSSVFILTYDEGGGLYDHVAPFTTVAPDDYAPQLTSTNQPGDFTETGFRVPFIMVSPWVKPGFVSHVNRETTSILKLIETRFNIPPLTKRDAAADDMTEFFDFTSAPRLTLPALPAQPTNGTCDPTIEAKP